MRDESAGQRHKEEHRFRCGKCGGGRKGIEVGGGQKGAEKRMALEGIRGCFQVGAERGAGGIEGLEGML